MAKQNEVEKSKLWVVLDLPNGSFPPEEGMRHPLPAFYEQAEPSMEEGSKVHDICFGTGFQIYRETILQAIETAEYEVVLITCFWAQSATRDALNKSLINLNSSAVRAGRRVRVRIGFSSSSFFQKLFHTASLSGRSYSSTQWRTELGLPDPSDLADLDLEVKSVFLFPFSVWHPKFVIIDRKLVILPSCNVSWEDWFEGCIRLSGPIVADFVEFWKTNWANQADRGLEVHQEPNAHHDHGLGSLALSQDRQVLASRSVDLAVPCTFLPSPHSRNPRFRLPWQRCAPPPDTPLNRTVLELFENAHKDIFLQTPNLTSPPVLKALIKALKRGVGVEIVTSERLMIMEQLVTAGTTTSRCTKQMIDSYTALLNLRPDEEAALVKPGRLLISYYSPRLGISRNKEEPQQSHVKLTIVDGEVMVFGSGNMDRASWYTSQELGVAFFARSLISEVRGCLTLAMKERSRVVFDSSVHPPNVRERGE